MVTPSQDYSETLIQQSCSLEERQLTFSKSIGHWFSVSTHSPSQTSCFFLLLASFLHLWKQKKFKTKAAQSELKKSDGLNSAHHQTFKSSGEKDFAMNWNYFAKKDER